MQQSSLSGDLSLRPGLVNLTLNLEGLRFQCGKLMLRVKDSRGNVNLRVSELVPGHLWENKLKLQRERERERKHSPGQPGLTSPSTFG